jgi:hypothetical protein
MNTENFRSGNDIINLNGGMAQKSFADHLYASVGNCLVGGMG